VSIFAWIALSSLYVGLGVVVVALVDRFFHWSEDSEDSDTALFVQGVAVLLWPGTVVVVALMVAVLSIGFLVHRLSQERGSK
jgi:hypothetical protein